MTPPDLLTLDERADICSRYGEGRSAVRDEDGRTVEPARWPGGGVSRAILRYEETLRAVEVERDLAVSILRAIRTSTTRALVGAPTPTEPPPRAA